MNLKKAYVADLESTGLLPVIQSYEDLHVFSISYFDESSGSYKIKSTKDYKDIKSVFENPNNIVVGHNFYTFDLPVLEKMFEDINIQATIIDSLFLSWYLEPNRLKEGKKHGLASYGEDFGVPKLEITDWTGLSFEEYKNRCEEDVKINTNLWHKQVDKLNSLYEDEDRVKSFINFINIKGKVYKSHIQNPLRLDLEACHSNLTHLEKLIKERRDKLIKVMPKDPVKSKKSTPKKMYKQDGSLSATGERWNTFLIEQGLPSDYEGEVEYIRSYKEPNPTSVSQVKSWLFSLGWKPEIFNESMTKNGVNMVPQVKDKEKNLCPSVLKLAEKEPAIKELEDLGVLLHRSGYLKGFLRDVDDNGNIIADIAGLTNTLRIRHRTLVNLPQPGINYGEYIRSVLLPPKGHVMIGSDLSGLESTTRNNFVLKYDKEFVEMQDQPYYDPHLEIAVIADMMSQGEADFYKLWKAFKKDPKIQPKDITDKIEDLQVVLKSFINKSQYEHKFHKLDRIRHAAKTTNYSAMYGVGANKLSKELKIKVSEARTLIEAYWKKNWSVRHFSSKCKTKTVDGQMWALNPLNNYWYSLRNEKDIFSTVNQSAGDYIFTLWQHNLMNMGVVLRAGFHDEIVTTCLPEEVDQTIKKLYDAIEMVNRQLQLKVPVGIDHYVGNNYSEVH